MKTYYLVVAALVAVGLAIQKLDRYGGTYSQRNRTGVFTIHDVTGAFLDERGNAIANVIENGGKVLAVKVQLKYYDAVKAISSIEKYDLIYTSLDGTLKPESKEFIDEIAEIKEGEIAVIKAGAPEKCEEFFNYLHNKLTQPAE